MAAPILPFIGDGSLRRGILIGEASRSLSTTSESLDGPVIGQIGRNVGELISITSGSIDTPMTNNSHGTDEGYRKVEDEQEAVMQELEGHVYYDENFGKTAFVGKVASKERIEEFLRACDLYDSVACRWRDIPEDVLLESVLYDPIRAILVATVDFFYPSPAHDSEPTSRVVIDSHNLKLDHHLGAIEGGRVGKSSPDVIIQGSGRNFPPRSAQNPRNLRRAAYSRCATPLEIKIEKNAAYQKNLVQMGVYAR
jgi:hypothetical protein